MTGWIGGARLYAEMAMLISFTALFVPRLARFEASPRARLRVAQLLLMTAPLLVLATRVLPQGELSRAPAQVFTDVRNGGATLELGGRGSGSGVKDRARITIPLPPFPTLFLMGTLFGAIGVGLVRRARELKRLSRFLGDSPRIRELDRVRVVAGEIDVPFSARLHGRAYVVVPTALVAHREDFRISIAHELQHHRQRDPQWAMLAAGIDAVFFWNPLVRRALQSINEFQEFACDRFLVGHRKVSPQAYGRCLLRAAEHALEPRHFLVGTTGIVSGRSGALLKRRVEMILGNNEKKRASWLTGLFIAGTVAGLGTVAVAGRSFVREGGIEMTEARQIVDRTAPGSDLPLVMTESVLKELNYFVGTAKGREFIHKSLKNMPAYQELVDGKIAAYGLPKELGAIPIVESGYSNMPAGLYVGAGLWMFIGSTARRYGLIVDENIDERLHEAKETDAAMRYLRDLNLQFHDWWLAIAAYNQGENFVAKQIKESGVSDAWALVELGRLNRYTSQTMAAVLILKNPALQP